MNRFKHLGGPLLLCALLGACATAPVSPDTGAGAESNPPAADTAHTGDRSKTSAPPPPWGPPVVDISGSERLGNPGAKLGILEFSDFQCPYCARFYADRLPELKKAYIDTGLVQYIHKDFPLRMHREAVPAALAAGCAGAQEKFWPMHDLLFDNQARLNGGLYTRLARDLGLDVDKFSACMKDPIQVRKIHRDFVQGRQLRVSGTPTIMLGRIEGDSFTVLRVATGLPDYGAIAQEIESLRRGEK